MNNRKILDWLYAMCYSSIVRNEHARYQRKGRAMMFQQKVVNALMVMIDLANHDDGGYVSLADISDRQKLSMKYLENVVSMLNKGGMLRSLRGKNGGYRLIKSPEDYNIGEILRITEGSLAPVDCIKSGEVSCGRAHFVRDTSTVDWP